MPDQTCIFCQIVAKTAPATVRYEDDQWLAFDDIHKTTSEHLLIIPKHHYPTLETVPTDDRDFHSQLLLTARKIAAQLGLHDYKLIMNVGDHIQLIPHLHLHLLAGVDPKQGI